ncbi:MAG: PAS domain-containing protein [bacterium]
MLDANDRLGLLNRLNRFSSAYTTIHTLGELAIEVEAVLDDIMEIEFSGLYLYDFQDHRLKLLFAKGFDEKEATEAERTAMERHPGYVFRTKTILNIPDTENDPEQRSISSERSFIVRSRLYVPVMNGSQSVGAFGLVSSKKNHFTEESQAILSFICNIAGGIYGNILMQAELRKTSLIARETDNAVIITGKEGLTEWVNRSFERMTGYTRAEIIGLKPGSLLQGAETDREIVARIAAAIARHEPIETDVVNYHKDGHPYWVRLQIQPVFNEHGELTNFIAMQRDITEQKKAQEEMESVTTRLATLIKNIHAGILAEDQHRKIALVNKTFCDLFGIPVEPELLIGSDCSDSAQQTKHLFRDPEQFVVKIDKLLKDKKPVIDEELELADGRVFERDYIPIFANDKFLGNLWRYGDITERKAAEKQIITLQKFYEQVLRDLPGHIAVFDIDLKYIYVNPAGVRDPEIRRWVIGKNDVEFCEYAGIDPEVGTRRLEMLTRVLNEKIQISFEESFTRKSGEKLHFHRWISPVLSDDGKVIQLIGYGIDVTERRKNLEELIEARRVAENSTRAKDLFLAQMSHEIRTPLNAVIGLAKLLRETSLTKQQEELVGNLLISGENLSAIISEILDFSKIEAGKIELESVPFSLPEIMKRVYSFQEHAAESKMITLRTKVDESIPGALIGDPVRLQQIMINLVSNAVKFTHKGGVEAVCELSSVSEGRAVILFSVTDTGIGIGKENLENIFERFQQEDASVTRLYGGTGLGLPISRQLVELMGGALKVESEKGKGSRFSFTVEFGITDQSLLEKDRNKPLIDADILKNKKILVVEDNAFNQFIVKTFLEKWGATVDIAENGQLAIAQLWLTNYDLVLMDMQMPVMDGLTATRILREELRRDIPVIALTANVTKEAIDRAFEVGMNEYISKPFDEDDLYLKVVTAVGGKPEFIRKKPLSGEGLKS